ncbi:Putative fucosyltransferase-like protein [Coccomyxa sp. Obi]|nr:Putative fucosyltransferase-like protein [Coccomyxa sp. Obi]
MLRTCGLMRWKEVRLLLLGVLVVSLAYNSWRSHSLVHIIWAPLSVRLSPVLLGARTSQTASAQTLGLLEQPTAGGNTHVKIKVTKGPATEGKQKVRLAIRRHQVSPSALTLQTANSQSSYAAEASKIESLQAATQVEASGSRTADSSGYDKIKQELLVGQALDGTASQDSRSAQEIAGYWQLGSDNVAGIVPKGEAKLPVQGAIRRAAGVPIAPAGQSCESWLSQADAHTDGRDFQRQPITVLEASGRDADLADCAIPCKIVGNSLRQNKEGTVVYDAHFGDSSKGEGLSVLRNMESMTNYPELAVERAHANGYDIVMTTRLDSDVPASYLSWAEYMVMKPLVPKQEDVAAFISNCGAKSFRLQALEALSANFSVHSYGRCMRNRDTSEPKPDVLQRYRFTLAFENSQELDYVTEKYIQALEAGSVPIVIGATNIADFEVAPNSMLVLETMDDMPRVAARMHYLIQNATAYNEMLAWKATGPQDKFLALLDLSVVHSSCSLCIHLATRIRAAEEAVQPRQLPCSCRRGPRGSVVHHVLVRERGRFDSRDVFLEGKNMTVAGLHEAIQQAFSNAKHVPIWRSHRPDFKARAWETASDGPVELRIYRVYQVGHTQRAALYGEASLDTDAKVAELLEANPCAKLEVVFI